MKRREFANIIRFLGAVGLINQGCSLFSKPSKPVINLFDIHPFIKTHPAAVFILKTSVESKFDAETMYSIANKLSRETIVRTEKDGYPDTTKIVVKPNWTQTLLIEGKIDPDVLGVHTDLHFIDGFLHGMREAGPQNFFVRECFRPSNWETIGYRAWAEKNGYDLQDLSSKPIWEQEEGAINFVKVPGGVVFREVGFMAPVNEPGTFLLNIAKLKSHGMGITASVKNLQGTCTHTFHTFCTRYDQVRASCDPRYHGFFHDDFEKHIEQLHKKHVAQGISRWDRPGPDGGIWQEQWVNRMLDTLSVTKTGLNIVEGIYAHEGDGIGGGPDGKGKDYMSNVVIFGLDPIRVDIIAHWIAGHEPGNFGLFHIAVERGMSDVLDPHDIPLYEWRDGKAEPIPLESIRRTPLLTYYLARDYGRGHEPKYHLVDEEFDYASWKEKRKNSTG